MPTLYTKINGTVHPLGGGGGSFAPISTDLEHFDETVENAKDGEFIVVTDDESVNGVDICQTLEDCLNSESSTDVVGASAVSELSIDIDDIKQNLLTSVGVSNISLDDFKTTSMNYVTSANSASVSNKPSNVTGAFIFVVLGGNLRSIQIVYDLSTTTNSNIYMRSWNGTIWHDWSELVTDKSRTEIKNVNTTISTTVQVQSGKWTCVGSFNIEKDFKHFINVTSRFAENATGARGMIVSLATAGAIGDIATSIPTQIAINGRTAMNAVNGGPTYAQITAGFNKYDTDQTVYVWLYQNSGATLACDSRLNRIKSN